MPKGLVLVWQKVYTTKHATCGITCISLRTQNSENDLFNPNITFYISLNKYIKLINIFGLGRHLLLPLAHMPP